jgi:ABC-type maltose transport system permease subunit
VRLGVKKAQRNLICPIIFVAATGYHYIQLKFVGRKKHVTKKIIVDIFVEKLSKSCQKLSKIGQKVVKK